MNNKRVIAVHLLNDFSGSPFVLRQSVEVLIQKGHAVDIFTATPTGSGFLSDIRGVNYKPIFYRWNKNKFITLFYFAVCQFLLLFRLLFHLKKTDIVYINSLLPFGAAIAAKVRGCKVVYHFHEVSIKPEILKILLLKVANLTASYGIFVSEYLMQNTPFNKTKFLIYNALPDNFIEEASNSKPDASSVFTILMACSLKKYKGVEQFIASANALPNHRFILVLNANHDEITSFLAGHQLPVNLKIHSAQNNMHAFYSQADVVVNLSIPTEWVETFGMTILEAMYYKKPVIIPPLGGITELATDNVEGFQVDSRNIDELANAINAMAYNSSLYQTMSANAYKKAQCFTPGAFSINIYKLFQSIAHA